MLKWAAPTKKSDTTFVCFVLFLLTCVDFFLALSPSICRFLIFEKYLNWGPRKRRNSMNTSAEMLIQRKCGRSSASWEMEPLGKCTRYAFLSRFRSRPSVVWLLVVKYFPFISPFISCCYPTTTPPTPSSDLNIKQSVFSQCDLSLQSSSNMSGPNLILPGSSVWYFKLGGIYPNVIRCVFSVKLVVVLSIFFFYRYCRDCEETMNQC